MSLGEAAPILVPVSQVMMCMNCTSDFSLTLRRHHCNACGKVRRGSQLELSHYPCLPLPLSLSFCLYHALSSHHPPDFSFLCSQPDITMFSCLPTQVVCRSCSRNRYPLKYLKDRMAKVCDHCYAELHKRGRHP